MTPKLALRERPILFSTEMVRAILERRFPHTAASPRLKALDEVCGNCGGPLWLDDPDFQGYHCRKCDEWHYPEQDPPQDYLDSLQEERG